MLNQQNYFRKKLKMIRKQTGMTEAVRGELYVWQFRYHSLVFQFIFNIYIGFS